MPVDRELGAAVRETGFGRLYATRLAGQSADGIFQVGLAGFVLFSPERQASAANVAAALAVLLIPFSLIGPFAGVLIDRWHRQRILFVTNLMRACAVLGVGALIAAGVTGPLFYATALVVISMNRFVLSTLSAGLPHIVRPRLLVAANAVSTTSGTIAAIVGAAIGYGVRHLAGADDSGAAVVMVAAAAVYLVAMLASSTLPRAALGPDLEPEERLRLRHALAEVAAGLVAALHHLRDRPTATRALAAMTAQRLAYGLAVVTTILLCRNYLTDPADTDAGLRALATVVVATGVGVLVGAFLAPVATRRVGIRRWVAACFVASAAVQLAFGLPYTLVAVAAGGALLGACGQSLRVCIDTLLQRNVDENFRGRVFALHDMLFNVAFVVSAVAAALVLPTDGHAPASVVVLTLGYLATAVWWLRTQPADDSGWSAHQASSASVASASVIGPRSRRSSRR